MFHRQLRPQAARCRKVVSDGVLELRRGKSFGADAVRLEASGRAR